MAVDDQLLMELGREIRAYVDSRLSGMPDESQLKLELGREIRAFLDERFAALPDTPTVNVAAPVVTVAAPSVNIEPPAVNVAAPTVNVAAPEVNVAAPSVTVAAPEINVAAPNVNFDIAALVRALDRNGAAMAKAESASEQHHMASMAQCAIIAAAIDALTAAISAPKTIVNDAAGKPIAVKSGT